MTFRRALFNCNVEVLLYHIIWFRLVASKWACCSWRTFSFLFLAQKVCFDSPEEIRAVAWGSISDYTYNFINYDIILLPLYQANLRPWCGLSSCVLILPVGSRLNLSVHTIIIFCLDVVDLLIVKLYTIFLLLIAVNASRINLFMPILHLK